ncbi:hypothetical protein C8F04DRAFT_1269359 [Mycena alexandri]|uniref:Uncharacterized protein n=1 Tax=Mycena alexandri TaxID=1745969 RepID=A0AAD6SCM3_9AGAR|nr:hypothetical protein C8F04DRAFT_1269359 [Mycena alexandri]
MVYGATLVFPDAAAEKQLAATSDAPPTVKNTRKKAPAKPLQQAKVEVLTEKICLNAAVNRVFHNPPLEITSLDCIAAQRPLPCSLCAARNNIVLEFPAPPLPPDIYFPAFTAPTTAQDTTPMDKKFKLTQKERQQAESRLIQFGETLRRAERKHATHANRPKSAFFPSSILKSVLDSLLTFDSFNDLATHVESWTFAVGYQVRLCALVHELRRAIESQRKEAQEEKKAARRKKSGGTQRRKRRADGWDSGEDSEDREENSGDGSEESGDEMSSDDDTVNEHPRSSPIPPPAKRVRRILHEVTNKDRPVRKSTGKDAAKKTQSVGEISQTYSAPYRTTSSRRRALDAELS